MTIVYYKGKEMVLARIRDISKQQQINVEKDVAINRFREMMDFLPQTVFEKGHFDLVISDYIMPRMSGLKLIQKFKSKKPNVKTIICSGHQFGISEK